MLSLFLHFYLLHLNSMFLFNHLLIIIWVRLSSFPKLFLHFSRWLHIWRLVLSIAHIIDLWNRIWILLLVYFIITCSNILNYWLCHLFEIVGFLLYRLLVRDRKKRDLRNNGHHRWLITISLIFHADLVMIELL